MGKLRARTRCRGNVHVVVFTRSRFITEGISLKGLPIPRHRGREVASWLLYQPSGESNAAFFISSTML